VIYQEYVSIFSSRDIITIIIITILIDKKNKVMRFTPQHITHVPKFKTLLVTVYTVYIEVLLNFPHQIYKMKKEA